jgi:hypothetical protein
MACAFPVWQQDFQHSQGTAKYVETFFFGGTNQGASFHRARFRVLVFSSADVKLVFSQILWIDCVSRSRGKCTQSTIGTQVSLPQGLGKLVISFSGKKLHLCATNGWPIFQYYKPLKKNKLVHKRPPKQQVPLEYHLKVSIDGLMTSALTIAVEPFEDNSRFLVIVPKPKDPHVDIYARLTTFNKEPAPQFNKKPAPQLESPADRDHQIWWNALSDQQRSDLERNKRTNLLISPAQLAWVSARASPHHEQANLGPDDWCPLLQDSPSAVPSSPSTMEVSPPFHSSSDDESDPIRSMI